MTKEEEILRELRRVVRLLAVIATQGRKQNDQIASLSQAGFEPREIAEVLRTTANSVRVALVRIRKGTERARSRSRQKALSDDE